MAHYDFIPAGKKVINGKLVDIMEADCSKDEVHKLLNEARAEKDWWKAEAERLEAVRVAIIDSGVPGYVRKDRKALENEITALKAEIEALKANQQETPAPKRSKKA